MTKINDQNGFAHIIILVIAVILLAGVGFVGWRAFTAPKPAAQDHSRHSESTTKPVAKVPTELTWQQIDGGWRSMGEAPACPDQPMMKPPVDMTKVTAMLYPGQTRGGNYKPHGGFRFDKSKNADIKVTAPIDGFIVRGGSYIAEETLQYTFDIMNNCGVMYRVGHFASLPDNLQKIADTWPPATADSRTQSVNPAVYVKTGDTLGTSVGITKTNNAFFDWGVYDYRQDNEASKSAAYQQAHAMDKELSWHAVCWFDWLPSKDAAKVKSLPAGDPGSGKTSDYCK